MVRSRVARRRRPAGPRPGRRSGRRRRLGTRGRPGGGPPGSGGRHPVRRPLRRRDMADRRRRWGRHRRRPGRGGPAGGALPPRRPLPRTRHCRQRGAPPPTPERTTTAPPGPCRSTPRAARLRPTPGSESTPSWPRRPASKPRRPPSSRSWPAGWSAIEPACRELQSLLPGLEAEAEAEAARAVAERAARSRLAERTAALAAMRRDLEVRAAGLDERRAMSRRRLAEVDDRLRRHVAERDEAAARRQELEHAMTVTEQLAALVGGPPGRARRDPQPPAHRPPGPRPTRSRPAPSAWSSCAASATGAERQLGEARERINRVELDETEGPRPAGGARRGHPPGPRLRARSRTGGGMPPPAAGNQRLEPAGRAGAGAAPDGPDQPARPRGARRPARATPVPRRPAGGRAQRPARADAR